MVGIGVFGASVIGAIEPPGCRFSEGESEDMVGFSVGDGVAIEGAIVSSFMIGWH